MVYNITNSFSWRETVFQYTAEECNNMHIYGQYSNYYFG